MAQVTIYINKKIEVKVKKLAKEVNLSTSKYASTILKQKTVNCWDRDIKNLSGAWSDFSTIKEIRNSEQVADAQRETF